MRSILMFLVLALAGASAFAESLPETSPSPHGPVQFSLLSPTSLDGIFVPAGLILGANATGAGVFSLGLGVGFGYCITDLVEVGAGGGFNLLAVGTQNGSAGGVGFSIGPTLKLNFGRAIKMDEHVNPYLSFELSIGGIAGTLSGASAASTEAAFGGALGSEFLITKDWGLTVFIPLEFGVSVGANTSVAVASGIGYGLVAYF